MERFKYPPCNVNPNTEKPYTRHKWVIPQDANAIVKKTRDGGALVFYRVSCSRCGLNDPSPPSY